MSTLSVFKEMSGVTEASALEITSERGQEIVQRVESEIRPQQSRAVPVNLGPVSTYVVEAKNPGAGSLYVSPKLPQFASHWGIIVGDLSSGMRSRLCSLDIEADRDGKRMIGLISRFESWCEDGRIYTIRSSSAPIHRRDDREFGSYHLIFWNCQIFAKCFLRVITGDDAVFDQWTSADVTNLFLCALILPAPIGSSKMIKQELKEKRLEKTGTRATILTPLNSQIENEQRIVTEEQLFELSDQVIDGMIESWKDDEILKNLPGSIKDSSDKNGLLKRLWSLFSS